MSSNKSGSPVRSPKPPKQVKLEAPKTPPRSSSTKRLLAFLVTPEQPKDNLPFSPGLKRTNLGSLKSPDYKLNTQGSQSPYLAAAVLKTPRNLGYESDERETPHKTRMLRTPQFFSPGRRLFAEDQSPNKQELVEISTQLKSKLSSALGKLKGHEKSAVAPVKLDFSELSFTSTLDTSSKKLRLVAPSALPPAAPNLRTNINLQTLQQLPQAPRRNLRTMFSEQQLRQSPPLTDNRLLLPSPDEESSAQNALLAAFSRVQTKSRRYSGTGDRRSLVMALLRDPHGLQNGHSHPHVQLPPLNVALTNNQGDDVEKDAVYSLMSLSSPQLVKKRTQTPSALHSRLHSQNENLPGSSRLSLVQLPPIAGIIRKLDNDETDVEEQSTEDEMSS